MNCHMPYTMCRIKGEPLLLYTWTPPILDITKRGVKTMKIHFTVAELYKKPKGNSAFNMSLPTSFIISFHFFRDTSFLPSITLLPTHPCENPLVRLDGRTERRRLDAWTMGLRDKQLIACRRVGGTQDCPAIPIGRDPSHNTPDV